MSWALCADARSGSTWLSQLVASTSLLGNPDEYLLDWKSWCERLGLSSVTTLDEYFTILLEHRSSAAGIFAIKGSLDSLRPFFALFPAAPCVWLRRRSKVHQAISWQRANDGGLWHRTAATSVSNSPPGAIERILGFHAEIVRREAAWQEFFTQRRMQPLMLIYEEVCTDPLAAVRAIADYVGVDSAAIRGVWSPLQVTRDEATDQLAEQVAEALRSRIDG